MKNRQVTVFNMAFLDLLSCGMGALILLALVFAASKTEDARREGTVRMLTVSVDQPPGAIVPYPLIGIYAHVNGTHYRPDQSHLPPAPGAAKVSLRFTPERSGDSGYTVMLRIPQPAANDYLAVYLYDLQTPPQRPPAVTVAVSSRLIGAGGEPVKFELTTTSALRKLKLADLNQPKFELEWTGP